MSRMSVTDTEDPNVLLFRPDNVGRGTMYYAMVNAPVNIFKWWRVNLYALGGYSDNKLRGYDNSGWIVEGQIHNMFTLPRNWSVEAAYMYMTGFRQGNILSDGKGRGSISVRKSFLEGKLNASLFVDNVLCGKNDWPDTLTFAEPGNYTRIVRMRHSGEPTRRYGIALSWNFRTGKDTRQVQKVTAGNEEERNR